MKSFNLNIDDENHLVKIFVVGQMSQKDGEEVISAARQNAMKFGYNILYDIRQATTKVEFSEWFILPRKLEVFKAPRARTVKAAVLVSQKDPALDDYNFYEDVTSNLGFQLKIFFDEAEALAWLK
jgi:hypothetical protein